ncbi:pentatricopeptide repeat-containing protein like [Capsicum galapagoense]
MKNLHKFRGLHYRYLCNITYAHSWHNLPHLSLLADQCTSLHQLKQIHAQMIIRARIHDNYAASRLLSFCALSESGSLSYASRLFDNIKEPNSFMWNTLIRAQAGSSNPRQALLLYVKMRRLCVTPGKHTFPFVLKACSNVMCVDVSRQVHCHAIKFGLDSDLHVVHGLIRAYSVCRGLKDARQVFDGVPERNLSIWTTMICGFAQNDRYGEAIQLFERMLADGMAPNGATLSSVLSACAQSGSLQLGEQIHTYMEENGIELGVILGTALVNMYAKNGAIVEAKKCFSGMRERNTATWNAMICGLAAHGHAKEAINFFKELEQEKVKPNDITLVGVLSACCHAGLFDYGEGIFHSMNKLYGIEPKIEHYGCMVDILGRNGKLLEAEQLIRGMIWEADVVIWGSLLHACQNHGNIDIAERVVKEILLLNPNSHGVYVVLSNMYAEAERWDDVVKLRNQMKEGSLKKMPGWSLVNAAT